MTATPDRFDAVIVGAGQAGNPLARSLAAAGRRVVLVERAEIGGACVNRGCTPTKALIATARAAHVARTAAGFGVRAGPVEVRLADAVARKDAIVADFRAGSEKQLDKQDGLTLVRGAAAFAGPNTVRVELRAGGERTLTADTVIINTGTRPARPHLPGLGGVPFLDSDALLDLTDLPEHLLVLGGGYVAVEFAQMFRRFGSRVTLAHRGPQVLAREDRDVADALAEVLRGDGIEVIPDAHAEGVAGSASAITLTVRTPTGSRTLAGSHLLVATGRTPNTDGLGLESAGVKLDDKGYVRVTERLETSAPGVYAAGDVTGGPAFTHVSHNDNQILRENLLHGAGRTTAGRLVPYTVFTDPQLGRVGLTEAEARGKGLRIRVARLPMTKVARAVETGETRGLMKAVVDATTGQVLGCAVLGSEGGEVMSIIQVAMMGRVPFDRLRDEMFAHPTLARGLNALFAALGPG